MENRFMKVFCISILMLGSALQAMDVNSFDKQRLNMNFRAAARNGNKQKVEKFIAEGADINEQNKSGENALMRAAEAGRSIVCQLLIAKGADINARSYKSGETALMKAAMAGHEKVCQLLIAHGANLYAQDKFGNTVLMSAADLNQEEICKLLINEMIKQEQKHARTTLYPILKEHKTMGRDTARLVTEQLQEAQKINKAGYKTKAHLEIMKIKKAKMRAKLLEYLNSL